MIKSWLYELTILGYEEVHVPELTPKSFETDEVSFVVNVHVWCAVCAVVSMGILKYIDQVVTMWVISWMIQVT